MGTKSTLIQFTSYGMGKGDSELSLLLANNYLNVIMQEEKLPSFIVCYNEAVKLLCAGSPAIELFKKIESKGVKILACTTCLKHYGLMDKLEVGIAATMIDIVQIQSASEKIINL